MAQQLYRTLTGQSQKSSHSKAGSEVGSAAAQPPTDLAQITTTNTTTGVLNHLTEAQERKLDEFKEALLKDGWWSPDAVNGKPTHDDGTLLRYLRARKFDVAGAVGQFSDTEKWMKEQKVEDLYERFDVDYYEQARLMYPQWTGHRDKRGIPVYVFEVKGLDSKAVEKYQKDAATYKSQLPFHKKLDTPPKLLPLFALYHNLLNFVLPLCSSLERPRPEVPVTNSTNIVDISGVSLRQFWNLKNHMQDASVLATAHYPETLDRIFIIGAPSFFPTVWSWIKRWFDPVTVSKIFILGKNEVKPTLESFMEPTSFPKKYGGTLDWKWGDVPQLDAETRKALERDGNEGWVRGPALWLNNERVVVGSENGALRRSEKEIAERKPIVYAADYTEQPVHPEKRRSTISSVNSNPKTNGGPVTDKPRAASPETLKEEEDAHAATAAATAATVATGTPVEKPAEKASITSVPAREQLGVPADSIRASPMGDSQVHLPSEQPAPPATTAEYISPKIAPVDVTAAESKGAAAAAAVPVAVPAAISSDVALDVTSASSPSPPPPPGHTQPGPLSQHTTALAKALALKLEGESTVIIPETANGALPHPEVISASDATKGLAVESEKMVLAERPHAERFVTAMEVPQNS